MKLILSLILLFSFANAVEIEKKKLKVLHLTFHRGCQKEINSIAKELNLDITTWFIPELQPYFFDGYAKGNALYNIGHKRAEKIWDLHKDFFNTFDVILTSDTAPLARIFLQNKWSKPLIIWICNRFDYCDTSSLDCDFPDEEFYSIFREAVNLQNVSLIAYNAFEHFYAKCKGVNTGTLVIKPCALNVINSCESSIPSYVDKKTTFFLPPYHNEQKFMNLSQFLNEIGVENYCGRYQGAHDLVDFKGIIHLPYAWSNLALFENVSLGIPYFIPSISFFEQLASSGNYFHPSIHFLRHNKLFHLSEWYDPENKELFTFFNSWEDLKHQIKNANYPQLRTRVLNKAHTIRQIMLDRWKHAFFMYPN